MSGSGTQLQSLQQALSRKRAAVADNYNRAGDATETSTGMPSSNSQFSPAPGTGITMLSSRAPVPVPSFQSYGSTPPSFSDGDIGAEESQRLPDLDRQLSSQASGSMVAGQAAIAMGMATTRNDRHLPSDAWDRRADARGSADD